MSCFVGWETRPQLICHLYPSPSVFLCLSLSIPPCLYLFPSTSYSSLCAWRHGHELCGTVLRQRSLGLLWRYHEDAWGQEPPSLPLFLRKVVLSMSTNLLILNCDSWFRSTLNHDWTILCASLHEWYQKIWIKLYCIRLKSIDWIQSDSIKLLLQLIIYFYSK